ncbi:MAG: hemolysin family protein [Candidatus Delongbacteria bacterium]
MEPPSYYPVFLQVAGFLILLCASMLFSAAETAFVSLSASEISDLKKGRHRKIATLVSEKSESLLVSLLLGNNLANVSVATIAALFTKKLFEGSGMETLGILTNVIVIGLIILLTGEIIPKSFAIRNRTAFVTRFSGLILFFYYIMYPLSFAIEKIVWVFVGNLKHIDGISEYTRRDIENLMEVGGDDGVLEEDEKNMINSIFEFSEKTAKEIMVPRVDMMTIPEDIQTKELFAFINENNFSRIPVYKDNIDNITGILYIKDLLHHIKSPEDDFNIEKIVREVTFIPESKDISELLKMFQREKTHIAIVVDEYGGTSGMITLEDIIEEIVGEIQDEFDEEERLYRKITDDSYEFDAKIPIDELNEILGMSLPEDDDYESLGGYLYDLFGEVPETGDKKTASGYTYTILSLQKQRIGWVKIERNKESQEENK